MLARVARRAETFVAMRQARFFGSSHHHDDHHNDHHDDHHDDHHAKKHYYNVHKQVSPPMGRVQYTSLRILNDIPHNDPSNPDQDFNEKASRTPMSSKMDPRRHIYQHHAYQSFDDHFFVGDFPDADIIAEREPNRQYKEAAVRLAVEFLRQTKPDLELNFEDFQEVQGTSWQIHGIEDIDDIKFRLWDLFADNIIVKENKFRPRIEQRFRKEAARR